jgi:DNA repair photolyase
VLLRLPAEVEDVFTERLRAAFPLRADKVLSLLRSMRGGRANDPRFGSRMRGDGPRWQLMSDLFARSARRVGLSPPPQAPEPTPFRRPFAQQSLFGEGDGS